MMPSTVVEENLDGEKKEGLLLKFCRIVKFHLSRRSFFGIV